MGICLATEGQSEEARRARDVGMSLADNLSPTSQELDELARREAMTPMMINCQTDKGEVKPRAVCVLPVCLLLPRDYFYSSSSPTTTDRSRSRCVAGSQLLLRSSVRQSGLCVRSFLLE